MRNQFRTKNLTIPRSIRESNRQNYVYDKFDDSIPSKNSTHLDFEGKILDDVRFVKVNSLSDIPENLTAKTYVDETISHSVDESSLLSLNPDENLKLDGEDSVILTSTFTSPKSLIELPTKAHVESLSESSGSRRDMFTVFNDQDIGFVNIKLTNFDGVMINGNSFTEEDMTNKNFV